VTPALACILLAIDLARSVDDLAGWWRDHQPALRVLEPGELGRAVVAKDGRKAALAHQRSTNARHQLRL
jgi:hypothetical protein